MIECFQKLLSLPSMLIANNIVSTKLSSILTVINLGMIGILPNVFKPRNKNNMLSLLLEIYFIAFVYSENFIFENICLSLNQDEPTSSN